MVRSAGRAPLMPRPRPRSAGSAGAVLLLGAALTTRAWRSAKPLLQSGSLPAFAGRSSGGPKVRTSCRAARHAEPQDGEGTTGRRPEARQRRLDGWAGYSCRAVRGRPVLAASLGRAAEQLHASVRPDLG